MGEAGKWKYGHALLRGFGDEKVTRNKRKCGKFVQISRANGFMPFLAPGNHQYATQMKHILTALALVAFVANAAQAQKQLGSEHNIEFAFTPLATDDGPVDASTLKYRKFLDEDLAFRLSLTFSNNATTNVGWRDAGFGFMVPAIEGALSAEDPVSPELHDSYTTFAFGLAPGIEKHFDGTDRLSPYIGVEVSYGVMNRSYDQEYWGSNDLDNIGQQEKYIVWTQTLAQSTSTVGLNLLSGFDFYLSDALYIGAEAGLGFYSSSVKDMTISSTDLVAFNLRYGLPADADAQGNVAGTVDLQTLGTNPLNIAGAFDGYQGTFNVGTQFGAQLRLGYLFE
jgi:hypothetical protein